VFGALAQMGGKLVRCLGIVRITFVLHLKAASYNLKRLVFLKDHGLDLSKAVVSQPSAAKLLSRGRLPQSNHVDEATWRR
jgi:hypothetical protein